MSGVMEVSNYFPASTQRKRSDLWPSQQCVMLPLDWTESSPNLAGVDEVVPCLGYFNVQAHIKLTGAPKQRVVS